MSTSPGWWRRPARRRAPVGRPPAHVRVIHPAPDPEPAIEPAVEDDTPARPGWVNDDHCPCTICTPPEIA